MRSLLLVLLLSISTILAKAQDKIITIQNDTIECRIISVNSERISYEQQASGHQVIGKSIAIPDVLQYFRSGELGIAQEMHAPVRERKQPEQRLLFSLQTGLAHSLTDYSNMKEFFLSQGNPESESDNYIKKLKNGYQVSTNFHYLLTSFFGVGVDYTFSTFSSKGNFLANGYSGMNVPLYTNMEMDEKLFYHFVGASVLFQQFIGEKRKLKFTETVSPGMVWLREETRNNLYQIYWGDNDFYSGEIPQYYDYSNLLTRGHTFGAKGGLSFEYCITPQLSAGLSGNFMWAKLKKVSVKSSINEQNDQELEDKIDISRIDYGFTLRYNFY